MNEDDFWERQSRLDATLSLRVDVQWAERRLERAIHFGVVHHKTLRRYRRELRQAQAKLAMHLMSKP